MEKLAKKFQMGLSIVTCFLTITMATAQTIMCDEFHPVMIIFWIMVLLTIALVYNSYNELKENGKK